MARPKAFDRDAALHAGMHLFWRRGFAATTTDELARAMGIGRQSFYDTFGGKRSCFLDALRSYAREQIGGQVAALRAAPSPLAAVRALLRTPAEGSRDERALGCFVVNALAEVGGTADDVRGALAPGGAELFAALTDALREARTRGEAAAVDERQAAHFLLTVRAGLMVHAKAGWPPEALRQTADLAVDLLCVPSDGGRPPATERAAATPPPARGPHPPAPRGAPPAPDL
jgi:AcrR family transcriptional regulator